MDKATEVIDRFLTEYGSRQTFNRTEVVDFVLDIRSALLTDYCHCGSGFGNSDHCPYCGCEQYEAVCEVVAP